MAGPNAGHYTATSKPTKSAAAASCLRPTSLATCALVLVLCFLSYLIGYTQRRGGSGLLTPVDMFPAVSLDFTATHRPEKNVSKVARNYPACGAEYSEYTPCEDANRSLRFDRRRLIYRDRHLPDKKETLKCRIQATYGYKNQFPWPESRDVAWYANVPHKELTVEKAVQNWIRFEGDRFRFPGGGTMFPDGADVYIDDIGRLIDLKSGSIRTAIDTGCGVASLGAYLLSREILTMSFAPRDTHEAQVQFALERGVPALIGVLASKRLPYPSRAFDMAHCSRCLIPWDQFVEADMIFMNCQSQAIITMVLVIQSNLMGRAMGQSCPAQLSNLYECAPFVVDPGAPNTAPSSGCCNALESVSHDCLCNTLKIVSSLPSACQIAAFSCST